MALAGIRPGLATVTLACAQPPCSRRMSLRCKRPAYEARDSIVFPSGWRITSRMTIAAPAAESDGPGLNRAHTAPQRIE